MNAAVPDRQDAKRLRIGYVFSQFPILSEAFAISDIAALVAGGHELRIFTMKPAPAEAGRLRARCGVPESWQVARPTLGGALRWPWLCWRYRRSVRELASRAARAVFTKPATALSSLGCIARALEIADLAIRSGLDVVHVFWSRHGGLVLPVLERAGAPCIRSAFVGAYDLVADDFLVATTLQSANTVFSHAEANRAYAVSRASHGSRVHIIHRGIPLPPFDARCVTDPFAWLTACALTPAKNTAGVLRAFHEASLEEPRLTLSICGEGPERKRLERLASDLGIAGAVRFCGHVTRDDLFRRMQCAGLFILLSKKDSERLPNVVKEALWAGCAVISSRSEGIEELIPDDHIGFVVDADDCSAIARAVKRRLCETAADSARRQARARAFIASHFSSERSMEQYVAAWRAVRSATARATTRPASGLTAVESVR